MRGGEATRTRTRTNDESDDGAVTDDLGSGGWRRDYSSWPTFPQLYVGGEFFGGCDITVDAFKDGSLKEELERAMLE